VNYYYDLKAVFFWNIFKYVIYSCDGKAEYSATLLQSHDPSEIILISCSGKMSYCHQCWNRLCCF